MSESHRMTDNPAELRSADARHSEEAVVDEEIDFLNNPKVMAEKEVVVPEGSALHGALHRDDGAIGTIALDGGDCIGKRAARYGGALRTGSLSGELTVSAGGALEGDAETGSAVRAKGTILVEGYDGR